MISCKEWEISNIANAIRGMRNPLESWEKSDSGYCDSTINDEHMMECENCPFNEDENDGCTTLCHYHYDSFSAREFIIGKEDLKLARKLIKAGSDHRKFLRQIFVSVDITAPLYWWKEFDTYKIATTANSTSTMHNIHKKPFTREDFSVEHLNGLPMLMLEEIYDECTLEHEVYPFGDFERTIMKLNAYRDKYLETKHKEWWYAMIQELPSSYNQTRTVTFTYETALNMFIARKNHKLDEWYEFCEELKELPYFKEFFY